MDPLRDIGDPPKRAAIVHDLGKTLVEARGADAFEEALYSLAYQTREVIGAHQSAMSYVPDGDFGEAIHTHSFSEKYEKYNTYDVMPTGEGIWGVVVEKKISMRMTQEDIVSHPCWKNFGDLKDERGLEHPPMRGWLAVPVLSQTKRFLGVLQLTDKFEGDFTEDDQELLARLASMVAPTFELQFVNETLQHRTEELQTRNQQLEEARANEASQADQLAKLADDLVRSNSDLEQFAYVASHDLQEPLRAVVGFCQLLKRRYEGKLDDKADEYLLDIFDGANRMRTLINDLLQFSRVGRAQTPFQPVACREAVDQALDQLANSIMEAKARVCCGDLPTVSADRTQLVQLFQNLISNAIKYRTPEPPEINITAERLDEEWKFSIRDNGIGIDPQFRERIFVIFQRLHTRNDYSGTGIGLALCKRIVERHGGRIWVESELDEGSTFCFTIPATRNENR
jgi:signal transduction histidine kinase